MRRKDQYDDFADELIHTDTRVRRAVLAGDDGELAFALADAMRERFQVTPAPRYDDRYGKEDHEAREATAACTCGSKNDGHYRGCKLNPDRPDDIYGDGNAR